MVQRLNHIGGGILLLILLAGCVTQSGAPVYRAPPPPHTQNVPPAYPPTYPQPAPAPIVDSPSTVVPGQPQPKAESSVTLALQDESHRAAAAGDLPKAIQILERAIRIQPDRAELWIDLARLHLKEGNPAQAEQFARKALLFTGQRYDLEQQAWVVIADARAAED